MEPPQKAPWALLCLAGWALLAAGCASATGNGPPCLDNEASGAPGCPHRKKAATLLPSFTETPSTTMMPTTPTTHHNVTNHTTTRPPTPVPPTPTHHTTVHVSHRTTLHNHSSATTARPQKHTTSHHHRRHTTTARHESHTTTGHQPHPTTSTHHTTTSHHSGTTSHGPRPTPSPHHTTTSHNGTTSHRPRPTPSPHHTTTRHHNLTTAHHHNFTTTHPPYPNTTAHPHNHTTVHPLPTTGHSPTHHTTAVLTTPAHHSSPPPPVPPTVVPFVQVGDYSVQGNASEVCLRAQMGVQLRVRYTKEGKEQAWGEFNLQPNRTTANGTCLDKTTALTLGFPEGFLSFFFAKNETHNTYYLSRVQARLTYPFPQAAESSFGADNTSLHEFEVHLGHSYQCRNRSLVLKEGFQLNVLRERIQAFGLPKGEFGEAEVCPEQRRSSALPIVVGVVLGLLILIVVVAFLFGRCRKRPGYQTL